MVDPKTLREVLTNPWPKPGEPGPDQATAQALNTDIAKKIATMPVDWSAYVGQLLVVGSAGDGPTVASASGVTAVDLGGLAFANGKTSLVSVTGSGLLTDNAHRGRDLQYVGTSAITLTINLDPTGLLGITDGFNCHLYRAYDAGSVGQLHLAVGTGITLQRPDGNLGVPPGNGVAIKLIGTRLYVGNAVA
jgi:hypothetical protein